MTISIILLMSYGAIHKSKKEFGGGGIEILYILHIA